MRLLTFDNGGSPALGAVLSTGAVLDLASSWHSGHSGAPGSVTDILSSAALHDATRAVLDAAEAHVAAGDTTGLALHDAAALRYYAPWRPGRIFAIGLNYVSHTEEQAAEIPRNPVVFTKDVGSLTGHGSPIVRPTATKRLDYEAELAVVIGRPASNVSVEDAALHIGGYSCLNDVSARELQKFDQQWFRAKSYPTFCPLGRDFVTPDEIAEVEDVVISCHVGDELRQSAPISDLIFDIPRLISFISSFVALETGDVIATGTPGGVGFAMDPPHYLQPGDVVTVAASGITELRNEVVAT